MARSQSCIQNVMPPSVGEVAAILLVLRPGNGRADPASCSAGKDWLGQDEFLDGLALCQLVPGATVVKIATTHLGFRQRRTRGVVAATAFIFPAFSGRIPEITFGTRIKD
jgi:hypothetical protein